VRRGHGEEQVELTWAKAVRRLVAMVCGRIKGKSVAMRWRIFNMISCFLLFGVPTEDGP
jgi:hypothetical protein